MGLLLMIVLILLLLGAMPAWPYSRKWGYAPSGALSLVLVFIVILLLFNVLPWWGSGPHVR